MLATVKLGNPDIRVKGSPGTNIVLINFNTIKAPFNDKRVRQAIAYAINYDLLTEKLILGYSEPLYGRPFMEPFEGEPGHGQFGDIKGYEYNPDKAKALLSEAGVSGFSTVIDTWQEMSEQAQAVAQMLVDVGIKATVRIWDLAVITEEFPKGERDIYFNRVGNGRRAPQWVNGVAGTGQPLNYALYSNPTFDDLMERAIAMSEDSPERNALFMEAFEIMIDELPVLTLHAPDVVEACRSNVKNFYASCNGRVNLHRVDLE